MSDRGVSEVLSFVLVFSIILVSITIVSVNGLGSLQDVRDGERIENAERAFDVLADNTADIHRRGAPSRATEISLGEARLLTGENVTMVVYVNDSSGVIRQRDWRVRPIVYAGSNEREIVYTAGAVFRTNRDGGVVIRDPPVVANQDRVLVSIVGINRPHVQSLSGSTVLVRMKNRRTNVTYRNRSGDATEVNIVVSGTSRADLWEEVYDRYGFSCHEINNTASGCKITDAGGIDRVYVVYHDIRVNIDP